MNISLVKVAVATLLFATAGASFAGPAVHPTTFDFSHMQSNGINLKVSGKLEFANAVLPQTTPVTAAKPITCTGGDLCSSNVDGKSFGGSLTYALPWWHLPLFSVQRPKREARPLQQR